MTLRPIVYLAGPDVFAPDCVERAKTYCAACADQNLKGLFPTPPLSTQLPKGDAAAAVFYKNIHDLSRVHAVIANISPFRGPGMDSGTAFEIGYAFAAKIPVFEWSEAAGADYASRVRAFHSMAWALQDGMEIEDFGQTENLMITQAANTIHATFLEAVDACAAHFTENPLFGKEP